MSIILRLHASGLILAAAAWLGLTAVRAADAPVVAVSSGAAAAAARPVLVVPVRGPIDKSLVFSLRRAFRQAHDLAPGAVVLELDTPGGGLAETEEIVAWLRAAQWPVYAYVNTHAQSAGAILCLACSRIYMAPGSNIGSATPVLMNPLTGGVNQAEGDMREKILSYGRSIIRGLAQENGHLPELGMAMMDSEVEVKIGDHMVNPKGQILNLTAQEAVAVLPPRTQPLLAAAIVGNLDDMLAQVGLKGAPVERFEETSSERLARWITLIGPLLLALGLLCIYIEFKTPGTMLPGVIGVILLTLYFFGHFVAGLAGVEDIVLVVIGLALLGVEVFILPGFMVLGLAGIALIVAGIVMGLIPHLPVNPVPLPGVADLGWSELLAPALMRFTVTMLFGAAGVAVLARFLPSTPLYRNLVLSRELTSEDGFTSHTQAKYKGLTSKSGTADSLLRPAGIAIIDGQRLDVVTTGEFIPRGAAVRVVAVEGSRIIVEKV